MAGSALKRLVVQASHYSLASVLTMLAGFVTFPLLTRVFSVADYGLMNLIAASASLSVAFGKLGLQHSIIRYQSEIAAGKSRYSLVQLYSTTLFGMLAMALAVALLLAIGAQLAPGRWLVDARLRGLFGFVSFLVVVQVVESALINFLRAEQATAVLMKYQVGKKYLGLALIVFAILAIAASLPAFYWATSISEAVALIVLARIVFRNTGRHRPGLAGFSRPLYRELLGFGLPMMVGYELSGIILSVGDRYVIEGLIGETPLGLYSAAYNLCQYVQGVFIASISQAIMPIYMRMWDEKGPEATVAFIGQSLRNYALFGAPIIAGLALVGPELLPSIATHEYASAADVLPWVIAGMVVDGTNCMLGAGLFIQRKSRTIMAIIPACAALNIVLNLLLVPRMGIVGSAIATLVSYAATALAMAFYGRNLLRVPIPWTTLLRAGLAALVMYEGVARVCPGRRLLTVGVRTVLGALLYAAVLWLIDSDARSLVRRAVARLRPPRKEYAP